MGKEVTATEAVRDFSGLLNTVKFKGETYIIKRGGKPIASIGPVMEANAPKTMKELKGILNKLPRMGDDLDPFEKDLIEVWKDQPSLPEREPSPPFHSAFLSSPSTSATLTGLKALMWRSFCLLPNKPQII